MGDFRVASISLIRVKAHVTSRTSRFAKLPESGTYAWVGHEPKGGIDYNHSAKLTWYLRVPKRLRSCPQIYTHGLVALAALFPQGLLFIAKGDNYGHSELVKAQCIRDGECVTLK